MLSYIANYLSIIKRKIKYKKISYSFNGVDLIINYIFKNKKKGFYVDIGAQHPISNNNTYLLFKKGWNGINIDLDIKNIELLNISRPNDINLNYAVSSSIGKKKLFFYHSKSPINTLVEEVSNYQKAQVKEIKNVDTITLNKIFGNLKLDKHIDYMNIDVEGHELDVLNGLDLIKYKPSIISIEYLDFQMNNLEFKNNNVYRIFETEFYKLLITKDYHFVNWLHGDLIFVHKDFRD
tara:strand:- start:989 stop:1696 length:708 start_codon:yes stop_codon:yes gene_type:complete